MIREHQINVQVLYKKEGMILWHHELVKVTARSKWQALKRAWNKVSKKLKEPVPYWNPQHNSFLYFPSMGVFNNQLKL